MRKNPREINSANGIREYEALREALESRARERARAEELETLMQSAPAIVWVASDPECREIRGNRAAAELLRMAADANMSKSSPDGDGLRHFRVLDEEGRELPADRLPLQAAARGREVRDIQITVAFEDGTARHLYGSAVPLRNPDGTPRGAVAAFADITERIGAEERLRELSRSLERRVGERTRDLERTLSELDAFARTVAHDLRAPARTVHRWGEVLLADFGKEMPEGARDYVRRMMETASRMDDLTRDLLGYIRLGHAEVTQDRADLDEAIGDALREEEAAIEDSGALVRVARPLGVVRGDRALLAQALSSLLSNAVKFGHPGRPPHVRVGTQPRGPRMMRVSVEDDGIGVEPASRDRLFRVFERLQAGGPTSGTGMGLAMVKRIAERLGGEVGYEPREGGGSTFWIELERDGGCHEPGTR